MISELFGDPNPAAPLGVEGRCRTCEARGITYASPLYTQCVEANTELITDQQRTAAENLPQGGGLPTYGADSFASRTSARTCLPVGSQPGLNNC
jgi:hypothetical protein